jgi:hypothetical protein
MKTKKQILKEEMGLGSDDTQTDDSIFENLRCSTQTALKAMESYHNQSLIPMSTMNDIDKGEKEKEKPDWKKVIKMACINFGAWYSGMDKNKVESQYARYCIENLIDAVNEPVEDKGKRKN